MAPHLKKLECPLPKGWFVPSLVEIGQVVWEEKMKMWKVYYNAYANDDNKDRQQTNFYQKSSFEPSAKVS